MTKKNNIKKRLFAIFGIILMICLSVIPAFAYSEPCDNCVDADYDTFCDNCGFDITAHSCPHNNTYTYYENHNDDQHIRVVRCEACGDEEKYVESHYLNNGSCDCGFSCSHDYDYWYSQHNEIQHIADYECAICGLIDATYYNYHNFSGNIGNIKCIDCGYVLNSYEGHYVSSISYVNGVNFTITTNDACKGLNRDFVTDEYGDFNIVGWCYMYFGVSDYFFEIYQNGTLIDIVPALVNRADTLDIGQQLAVQNRSSLGFHYNEAWCANSSFDVTAELAKYNGGTFDIVLSATTGAGVSVQMARFHTVTVNATEVKETEETTEETIEETEETTEETEETTEETTEYETNEPVEPPFHTDDYNNGYNDGYKAAYDEIYNSPIKNADYTVSVTFTDYLTGLTSTLDYPVIISGGPVVDFNYLVGDGLLLKDVFRICQSISLNNDGTLKSNIESVKISLKFDGNLSLSDGSFYFQCYEGVSFDEINPHDFTVVAIGIDGKRNGCVLYPINDIKYGISSSVYSGKSILVNEFEITIPLNYLQDTQYIAFWYNMIGVVHNQVSYNQGFFDGGKDMAHEYENSILPDLLDVEWNDGYNVGYNVGFGDGYKDQNNFYNLIGSVFDGMTNTFFSLFSFEIMGVNVAGFILSILTILVVVFLWRKFS